LLACCFASEIVWCFMRVLMATQVTGFGLG
jgi:hypothetical protein